MNIRLLVLVFCQVCYWFSVLVGISLSSVIGLQLAPVASLATLPFGLISLGTLLSIYLLSMLMQSRGHYFGIRVGALSGVFAALICSTGIYQQNFYLFCIGNIVLGVYAASAAFYRLAALDVVDQDKKGAAMGWVLSGGIIAAIIGPYVAGYSNLWFEDHLYLGSYLLVSVLTLISLMSTGIIKNNVTEEQALDSDTLNETVFFKRLIYWMGVINTCFGQFLMMLVMVIAPLAMHGHHHTVVNGVSVIGWHLIGMFAPSFFTGKLLDRFGNSKIVTAGLIIFFLSAIVATMGTSLNYYYFSLFLLGVGWNFTYMAGTGQYNLGFSAKEKGKAQGVAELMVSISAIIAVVGGGSVVIALQWQQINRIILAVLVVILMINILMSLRSKA